MKIDEAGRMPTQGRGRLGARLLGVMAIVLVAIAPQMTSQAMAPRESIDDFIEREMPASGVPGLAYAVVIDGEIEQVGARGVMEIGDPGEVTPDTPFVSGSISKSFTALAVMQLVEAGKVDLDAEVSRYLEELSGRPSGAITIRQLLGHTSGFSTLQGNTSHADPDAADDLARTVQQSAGVVPAHPAGTTWAYSNLNYQLLGRVIEVVSGQTYQAYVESNIIVPVSMKHSFVADGEVHDEMATGHRPWFGTKRPLAENTTQRSTAPQGGVVASASDLALYMQVMMNGEDDVLSAKGKAAMMRPASDTSPWYGFGWFLDADDGTVWHSGSTPGVETLATMRPDQQSAVVVLVNAGSGVGFGETTELLNGITARAIGTSYEGEGGRVPQKAMFVALVAAPFVYLACMLWAWRDRDAIRAKSGASGLLSLWLPLITTSAAAIFIFGLVPRLFGVSMGTLSRFQPDLVLALSATAVTGVAWAVFRLGVARGGKSQGA